MGQQFRVLGPTLAPGARVVLETLRAHNAVGVPHSIARRGARRRYVPPSSPDLAPIDPGWSKIKTGLRQAKARLREALDSAIPAILATGTEADAQGWFRHGGYALQ
jgi:hypothetical protein